MENRRNFPLDGVTVLDLGQVYQGPYAGFLLAQAGADVIKIEPPHGEPVRHRMAVSKFATLPFSMLNANKKGICLNLKTPEGVELFKKLAMRADVLLENFAPGVMDRLGIGFDVLHGINPRLVYASGTGFGLSGPDRDKYAMDITVQASSGMMSVTGFPDGPPVKAGPAVVDFISGTHLYAGIVTALLERTVTGIGRLVEVSMLESVYPTLASNLSFVFEHDSPSPRTGNRHGALAESPYNVYPAADGYVAIFSVTERHWRCLAEAMRRPELTTDPRFLTSKDRSRNMELTDEIIGDWTRTLTRSELSALLDRHKVPFSVVRNLVEVANDPHMHSRGTLEWVDDAVFGRVVLPRSAIRYHGADLPVREPAPGLGEHTNEILSQYLDVGLTELGQLREAGIVA